MAKPPLPPGTKTRRPPPPPRKEPSFNQAPTEAKTGNTNGVVSDWRLLMSVFDELEPEGKDALTQIAHALLRAQVKRSSR